MAQTTHVADQLEIRQGLLAGKAKFIIGGLLIVAAIAFLAVRSFQSSAVYYLTLQELDAKGAAMIGRDVRISAKLDKESIEWDNANMTVRFKVVEGEHVLPVVYSFAKNPVPDTLELGESVVVEGQLGDDGVFYAHTIFVQCPSKYEAEVQG
jgi:cytochrome c-type biogenesis protein CcmE